MEGKVFNPHTGRYVKCDGRTAKKYNLMSPTKKSLSPLKAAPADFKEKKPLYRPYKSSRSGKKGMVYVKSTPGNKKLIHFGDSSMSDYTKHHNKKRRKNYLNRSGGIRNEDGKLTKNDRNSANYWARRVLW